MENISFDDILRHVYELEGLLMVSRREDADCEMLLPMMRDKVELLGKLLAGQRETVAVAAGQQQETPQTCVDVQGGEQQEEQPISTGDDHVIEPEPVLVPGDAETIAADSDDLEPEQETGDDYDGSCHDSNEEPAAEMTFDYVEPQKVVNEEDIDETNSTGTEDDVPCGNEEADEGQAEAVTVDDLLQRSMSRDLKRVFTINDRFRFRRELFGNSDVEMNDAINLVEAMQSYAEAEEYFYDMLNWNRESPEVIDFMAIIRNHFYAK